MKEKIIDRLTYKLYIGSMSKFWILKIGFVLLLFDIANSNPVPLYDNDNLNHINNIKKEELVWETDIAYFIYGIIIIMLIYFLV